MSSLSKNRIYLDHNATTFTSPKVIKAVAEAMAVEGNPTAQHVDGRAANGVVSRAREAVGLALGVCAQDVLFTSGGTEADNTAIWSAIQAGCKHLLISSMDHPATILAAENFGVSSELIPADSEGRADMSWLAETLNAWDASLGRPFVSLVAANSETGVVQDIEAATELVRNVGGLILVDAVQALGKIPMSYLPDYLAVSAHKIGGPKGVGALYVAPDAPFTPLLSGGGQERRRRSGTHNVGGIAGFGAACDPVVNLEQTRKLRDTLETELKRMEPNLVVFGERADRLPNTSFFAVPDASSMTLMMALDLKGFSVSTGTACSSGKVGESRSIKAMGRLHEAPKGAIRVSFGEGNTLRDVESFLTAWADIRKIKLSSPVIPRVVANARVDENEISAQKTRSPAAMRRMTEKSDEVQL
jgi:cysteine desulfurase